MNPHTHFLFPFFIGMILAKLNILSWKLAVVCGVLGAFMDIDHYIEHIIHSKKKRFSLIATWNDYHKYLRSIIHHWRGVLVLTLIFLVILFFNWKIALILGIAYYSHLVLDYAHLKREHFVKGRLGKIFVKESYLEIYIDVVLIVGLLLLFIL